MITKISKHREFERRTAFILLVLLVFTSFGTVFADTNTTATSLNLKKSSETTQYTESAECKISIPGSKESKLLKIKYTALPSTEGNNKPRIIDLIMGTSKLSYKNTWNDGLSVAVADLDVRDKTKEIYITVTGTDIETPILIYRFDGKKIYKYDELYVLWLDFVYDGRGHIYFSRNDQKLVYDHCYNLKTKKTTVITDKKLLAQLKKMENKNTTSPDNASNEKSFKIYGLPEKFPDAAVKLFLDDAQIIIKSSDVDGKIQSVVYTTYKSLDEAMAFYKTSMKDFDNFTITPNAYGAVYEGDEGSYYYSIAVLKGKDNQVKVSLKVYENGK